MNIFGRQTLELIVKQPLNLTNTVEQYDVIATVAGGGPSGQAGAIRHGISRALLDVDGELRQSLKSWLLTRDPRMKERKNTVLKSPQSKPILQTLIFPEYRVITPADNVCRCFQYRLFIALVFFSL